MTSVTSAGRLAPLVIIGPQYTTHRVGQVLRNLRVEGTVALVTAGWQEHEGEDQQLRSHIGLPCVNLVLYRRGEQVARRDRELLEASRLRRDRRRQLQELYRLRLTHLVRAAKQLLWWNDPPDLIEVEGASAIELLR